MGSVGHGKDISFYAHLYFPFGTKAWSLESVSLLHFNFQLPRLLSVSQQLFPPPLPFCTTESTALPCAELNSPGNA